VGGARIFWLGIEGRGGCFGKKRVGRCNPPEIDP